MYKKTLLTFLVVLFSTACATSYGPNGVFGGYSETKVDNNTYIVSFKANSYTSQERVWYFWLFRCAELTREKGSDYFTITSSRERIHMYKHPGPHDVSYMLNAQTILDDLHQYVKTNGKAEKTGRMQLLLRAALEAAIRRKQAEGTEIKGISL